MSDDINPPTIIINDPMGIDFLLEAHKNGSEHKQVVIYPSIYTDKNTVHVLVSYQTYAALTKAFKNMFKYTEEPQDE